VTLTYVLLAVIIVLLLLLFLTFPTISRTVRARSHRGRRAEPPAGSAASTSPEVRAEMPENDGHELSGGARVEEPAAALERGYRRVDPAHDLSAPQGLPAKKNGKPH